MIRIEVKSSHESINESTQGTSRTPKASEIQTVKVWVTPFSLRLDISTTTIAMYVACTNITQLHRIHSRTTCTTSHTHYTQTKLYPCITNLFLTHN